MEDVLALKELVRCIQHEHQSAPTSIATLLAQLLRQCQRKTQNLADLVDGFGFETAAPWRRRKWSAVKSVLRRDRIAKYKVSVEAAKTALLLAQGYLQSTRTSELMEAVEGVATQQAGLISTTLSTDTRTADIGRHVSELHREVFYLKQVLQTRVGSPGDWLVSAGIQTVVHQAICDTLRDENIRAAIDTLGRVQVSSSSHDHRCMNSSIKEALPSNVVPDESFVDSSASSPESGLVSASAGVSLSGQPSIMIEGNCLQGSEDIAITDVAHVHTRMLRLIRGGYSKAYRSSFVSIIYRTQIVSYMASTHYDSSWKTSELPGKHYIETSLTIIPTSWLLRTGYILSVTKSQNHISSKMSHFPIVPNHAKIFASCARGDLHSVRSLLEGKEASPWDTDLNGWTPLHVWLFHRLGGRC